MKICLNNFFHDLDLFPFYKLFECVFDEKIELGTLEDSDILVESVFGDNTFLYEKKWLFTFLFIGESDRRAAIFLESRLHTLNDYSCVLKGEKDRDSIVNFPLFVLYSYCFHFTNKFTKYNHCDDRFKFLEKNITQIPPKDVCVIMSNGYDSEGRNYFCERLEQYVTIDYAGSYKNNVPRVTDFMCSPGFIDFVSQYKIILTMENSKNNTYITEKILHGLAANTISVYWGSDNIGEYFNEERFINVKSFDENDVNDAIEKIVLLINDNAKYLEMVNKPIYTNNRVPFTVYSISNNIKNLLHIKDNKMKKFITFGGPTSNFHDSVKRICKEAEDLHFFDKIKGYTEIDLKNNESFWEKHGNFIENNSRGYGYWIWKSFLIKKELDHLNENDILIFCDAGCQINKHGKQRLLEYIDLLYMNHDNYGLISFQLEFKEMWYTKQKIFEYFDCDESSKHMLQCAANIIIIKKNSHSMNIINEWYNSCNHYHLINDEIGNEDHSFRENRHDQSILSILCNKYGSIKLLDETYFHPYWDEHGKDYPFLAKRIK